MLSWLLIKSGGPPAFQAYWWNWFENEASEIGQFGGIISGSVHPDLWAAVRPNDKPDKPTIEPT